MARLFVREGPAPGTAYELNEDTVSIGRDPSNVIQIPSETVSRNHAALKRTTKGGAETWTIKDLKSKNGVTINGRRAASATLTAGDEIRLGESVLLFIEHEFDAIEAQDMADRGEPLMMRDVLKADTLTTRTLATRESALGTDTQKRLLALLDLGRLAGTAKSYPELFQALCSAVEQNIRPHRTVPILFDEKKGLLRPWMSRRGAFDKHLANVPISSTIVNYVRKNRAAILSEAAQKDDRFRDARSITRHEITSAMCAPIHVGERLLGAIYVDRLGDADRFSKADLELLTALAMQAAAAVENVRVREEIGRERYMREKEARGAYDIAGQCDAMKKVFRFIGRAAPTDASVLIEGESGTGKELVARAIHVNSKRRHQAFEAVNCAAMAPSLLESELFGHVRGAFTGADRDRRGRFELADGVTLFLDEIGELPEGSQSKLLRAIESGEIRRVGGVKDVKVNVRVLAATNKRLADEIGTGRFREDLYFRLNVLKVSLPRLKDRGSDIRLLAEQFLEHFAEKCGRTRLGFSEDILALFDAYEWPGNVREMKNAIERMVVMAEGEVLGLEDVPFEIRSGGSGTGASTGDGFLDATGKPLSLSDVEGAHIQRVLRYSGGNKKETARILGIDRSTLYARLKVYDAQSGRA